jgi:hypothetical protein
MSIKRGAALALVLPAVANADVVADSVADFSGTQGQGGWSYGYIIPSDGLGYRPLPQFGQHSGSPAPGTEPSWFVSYFGDPILFPTPYTSITAQGGHPNGGSSSVAEEQWTVRRWTAPFNGVFDVSGVIGDYAPDFGGGGDGVLAEASVGGSVVWSLSTSQTTAEMPYAFQLALSAGEHLDLIVRPKADENTDYYVWTAQIVPAPASVGLAALASAFAARRRSRRD